MAIKLDSADKRGQGSRINVTILRMAADALEDAGYTVKVGAAADDDPAVLTLTFTAEKAEQATRIPGKTKELIELTLVGELGCLADGDRVAVWKQSREVAKIAPELLRQNSMPSALRTGVGRFFSVFLRDVKSRSPGSLGQ